MRSLPDNSSSACESLNRWRCSTLCSPAGSRRLTRSGAQGAGSGMKTMALPLSTCDGMFTTSPHTTQMLLQTYSMLSPLAGRRLRGIHSRTDYDLSRHQAYSGKKMTFFDPRSQERFVPYVVETSAGLDRTVLMLLCNAYREEDVNGASRVVMAFKPSIAPIKVAVFPLVRKAGMPELARALADDLQQLHHCVF